MKSLAIRGEVAKPRKLSVEELSDLPASEQVADARELGAKRPGQAVRLAAVLDLCEPSADAKYLGLHASADDFHASVPLAPLLARAIIIYSLDGQPLPTSAGGPFRLYIPNHTECHMSEIDECANVKFIDEIELTSAKGFDNRPDDDEAHEELHRKEGHSH
jgi:DMSO/TMAO reductase YedYZ molybdopterin-dependent catalytic subunit